MVSHSVGIGREGSGRNRRDMIFYELGSKTINMRKGRRPYFLLKKEGNAVDK